MPKTIKKHLAVISILVTDRQSNASNVNNLLTEYGHSITARLGVNIARGCIENCSGLITIVVEEKLSEINELTKKLDSLYGIVAKSAVMTD